MGIVAGCGGGNAGSAKVNGNYAIQATPSSSSTGGGGGYFLGGPLNGSGSGITGTFHIIDSANCVSETTAIPVSGSDSGTTIKLATSSALTQVITIKGAISSDGATISSGTYNVTGSCTNNPGGTVTGFRVAPFTGNYTGNLTVADNVGNPTTTQFATTANFTQSGSADMNGFFSVTGPVVVNSPCFANFAIAQSQIFGTQFLLVLTPNGVATGAGVPTLTMNGYATDATAKQISGRYTVANMSAGCTTNGFVLITAP